MANEFGIHNCQMAAFIGMDKYEYILYLSRVLYHLGKKVLMMDCSESGALSTCVPIPEGVANSVLESRGVSFKDMRTERDINSGSNRDIDMFKAAYDCILADCGFRPLEDILTYCDNLVFVTDQKAHNLRRISSFFHTGVKNSLVIKDIINNRVSVKYMIDELNQGGNRINRVYTAFLDDIDSARRISCQYDLRFHFHKLSKQTKNIIKGLVYDLFPEIPKKVFQTAYKKAEKGE